MSYPPASIQAVARAAQDRAASLVASWLPAGIVEGGEYCVGSLAGEAGRSLKINIKTGKWKDFSAGDGGRDLVDLFAALHGIENMGEAARDLAAEIGLDEQLAAGGRARGTRFEAPAAPAEDAPPLVPILPVPESAPEIVAGERSPPLWNSKRGRATTLRPTMVFPYRDATGRLIGYVLRAEFGEGGKITPQISWCALPDGTEGWAYCAFAEPRPLLGLDELAARPAARVLVVEGEKARLAGRRVLGDEYVVVTWPGGTNAVRRARWSVLAGRDVWIWPDADWHTVPPEGPAAGTVRPLAEQPGWKAAQAAAAEIAAAGARMVSVVEPDPAWPDGADLYDFMEEARGREFYDAALLSAEAWSAPAEGGGAPPPSAGPGAPGDPGTTKKAGKKKGAAGGGKPPGGSDDGWTQRAALIEIGKWAELWRDAQDTPFATIAVDDHFENWQLRSKKFRRWLIGRYYDTYGGAPGGQAYEDALRVLEMLADRGPRHETFLRIGHHEGNIYLDLGDDKWRAVRIRPLNWDVVDRPPLKLIRNAPMKALPEPERGEPIDRLRPFLNTETEGDFLMIVGVVVSWFMPRGPYPILMISGEHGTAKSTATTLLRNLVDPRDGGLRALPTDERDLGVAAHNARVLAFDNISSVTNSISDALCRLATGGGFATRENYSDRDETIFAASRPIVINGIKIAGRADMADRAVQVGLAPIRKAERMTETQLWEDFEGALPYVLGAFLDAVASALGRRDEVRLTTHERMADFCEFITAAEPGLGWAPGSFMAAYRENRERALAATIENDSIAAVMLELVKEKGEVEGSASELLVALEGRVSERVKASRQWPNTPQRLGGALSRAAPVLRDAGVDVEHNHSGATRWCFRWHPQPGGDA